MKRKRLQRQIRVWWRRQDAATRELPHFLRQAFASYMRSGSRRAAALAYYAVFSIFPLLLLLSVGVSKILGPATAQQQIANGLAIFLPNETSSLLQENLSQALDQGGSFTIIAVVGLIWSALGLFSNITMSLDAIFRVPARRSLWRQRLVAVGMTLSLVVLVTASFVTSGVLRLVAAFLLERPSIWISIGTIFLPLGLNMVIFALLFRYVPTKRVNWDAVWPAAIFGAVGWELAKAGFGWYITNVANFQFIYGGIATAIVLLLSSYIIAAIFLFSAELCSALNEWILQQQQKEIERAYAASEISIVEDINP